MRTPRARALCVLTLAFGMLCPALAAGQDKQACVRAYEGGQASRDAGRLVDARRQLALCASDACPRVLRGDCMEWLRGVDGRLPTVVVRVVDAAGRDAVDAMLAIDGGAPRRLDGTPLPLDPGPHALHVTAGSLSTDERAMVVEAEKERVIVMHLPPSIAATAAPQAATSPVATVSPAPAESPAPSAAPLGAFLSVGLGAAALGAATYFYVAGLEQGSSLERTCGSPPSCSQHDADAAHTKLVIGDVLAGLGLVCVGLGTYLFLHTRNRAPAVTASAGDGLRIRF